MDKYDVTLDVLQDEHNSYYKILKQVQPHSVVLEFGPAGGFMTEYMRDVLSCDVYIVEIVEEYFNKAMEFAKDGVLCDASTLEWLTKFENIQFDCILFSDVLEHLYDPKKVLKNAVSLLKDDGHVLMTVPNIAHNSIIINLINNEFGYRKNGLLDNTHIRFFTYYSLHELLDAVGLIAVVEDATYTHPHLTEFKNNYDDLKGNADILKEKHYENVYQFVFTGVKKDFYYDNKDTLSIDNKIIKNSTVSAYAQIFFDTGKGFNEEESLTIEINDGYFNHEINVPYGTTRLRFDPVAGYLCIVDRLRVSTESGSIKHQYFNGFTVSDYDMFLSKDSQYVFDLPLSTTWLSIEALIYVCRDSYIPGLFSGMKELTYVFSKTVEELRTEILNETQALEEQTKAMENLLVEVQNSNREYRELNMQLSESKIQAQQYLNDYNNIVNSRTWRLTRPYRWFVQCIKNIAYRIVPLRLFVKFVKRVRQSGFRVAFKYARAYQVRKKTITDNAAGFAPDSNFIKSTNFYDSEYQVNYDFSAFKTDIKPLAFYLPQFHRIPENDAWWGEGFTEWTNTRKARPSFQGHYQPREPHEDLGYYSLDTNDSFAETMKKQAYLAKQHGIYGFVFYQYWFSGKRLLEKPVDFLLKNPDIDINFCLCWANENWTRTWDGQDRHVLMGQEYSNDDPKAFIQDIKPYVNDLRYIRVDEKPVIVVYNPSTISNRNQVFETWRTTAKDIDIGEIIIWVCETAGNSVASLKLTNHVDCGIEFPPHGCGEVATLMPVLPLDIGHVFDYTSVVKIKVDEMSSTVHDRNHYPVYRTPMMAWDNAARRKVDFNAFYKFSLRSFYDWCSAVVEYTSRNFKKEHRFMFVNAWNEWAEGTYLEPDKKYGYANLNTLSKAIHQLPFNSVHFLEDKTLHMHEETKIAIQVHLYYDDLSDELIEHLNTIPYRFDCYISTDSNVKKQALEAKFTSLCKAVNIYIDVFPNQGRDVAPFLFQMKNIIDRYEYIGHIHTKKSLTVDFGDGWRKYLYNHLLGSTNNVKNIFNMFEHDQSVGLIFPQTYNEVLPFYTWGTNVEKSRADIAKLLRHLGVAEELPQQPTFPAGNMFWARVAAIRSTFMLDIDGADFPKEEGHRDGTFAHVIERHWVYLVKSRGYRYLALQTE